MKVRGIVLNILFLIFFIALVIYSEKDKEMIKSYDIDGIPSYSGEAYVILNNNEPVFENYGIESFQEYSELDYLGRAGIAIANLSYDMMPDKKRESIGMIKPSGWHTVKYDIIEDKYLYNRCHLIAYQLTGENDNEKNLITCTSQMNKVSMLKFENDVATYIRKTKNHVLYRVSPIYYEDNLVASGVQMEAYSVEDNGAGIKFNVFIYNIQDGIIINYKTGESRLNDE